MNLSHLNSNPLLAAPNDQRQSTIGRLLLEAGKLTPEQVDQILRLQEKTGLPFGEAAKKLRYVTEADIRQVLAIQFGYPYLQTSQNGFSKALVAAYQPFSPQVEALRALRSQLLIHWFNDGNKALAVVSANANEGCSDLAANLAVVFSQLGERTLLIDANLREPSQKNIFNLREHRGLSDILVGRANMDVVTKIDSLPDLFVLGAGTVPPNPQELLSRKGFIELMGKVRDQYNVVILDTPPAIITSDAQTIASRCGGALLVSRLNKTRLSDLANVRDQLLMSDVQIVTAIVNDL